MKNWILFILLFVCGLLCGWGVSLMFNPSPEVEDTSQDSSSSDRGPEKWADERMALQARIATQSERIASIEAELKKARELLEGSQPEVVPELSEEERRELAQQRFAERMSRRLDGRIDRMATAYSLNETQKAAIKELYLQRAENQRARRNGEDVERFDMDAALSEIMSEDQFATYLEETQENIYNRAEMLATTQTLRLSQVMSLHPDVESMVYDTLNLTSQEMMIAQQEGEEFNFREVTNERLSTILTAEEMEIAKETLRFGPGGGGGRGRFPGP